ncbi:MAG: hypothetical protein MJ231_04790 [bacterium]|nr:hypothetical protein [bacterium]
MRKRLALLLISLFLLQNVTLAAEDVFQGHAEYDDEFVELDKKLYTGKTETLEKRDTIEMTVSQVIDGSFSFEGDEFFAQVTGDVIGDKGVIIPKGTVAHGTIQESSASKRLGRDGYINLSFDYLVTPDGREIPIEGKMSTKLHPVKAAAKIVATDVGYTLGGGAIGGFMAVQALGLEAAIASQGWTVAGGAAVGGAVGLGMSLYRKGKDVLIAPGDEIKVKILSNVELPVYRDEALKQEEKQYPGIDIRVANILYEKDPFGEVNTLTLSVSVSNMSDRNFSGMDICLMNDYNNIFNPSIFGDTKLVFSQFKPGDRRAGKISFAVDNVKHSFWLVVNDRRTNKPLVKVSLDNAYKNVSKDVKKRNDKIKKHKKNYYKEEDPFAGT